MIVIPAIDLAAGKCVRLRQGDMNQQTVYSDSPADMARHWADQGAEILHVVDLDGAMGGRSVNLPAIEAIVGAISIPVELGGGLRTADDVRRVLGLGVQWAIMGTSALRQPDQLRAALAEFGERIIVGIDARDGKVAVLGWTETSDISAVDLAKQMQGLGVQRLICTDIATDGMLVGPNLESLRTIAEAVDIAVIASGGVSKLEDIVALKALEPLGVIGAITGKALYEGTLNLKAAIAAAR
ncbi:1-(5-phosphoribosyl)-5-[(5-phosphoribosylamino)methylideneamino]imidazole-4-carboxamide isomerase [bacterium]|nr:1-(5-phosphoribosyl)-5-[(5-phosphoribosylamino)methylideneamino]imidazole-4-carboxamide isomerase [bacterium]